MAARRYVPVLKGKRAEWAALTHLATRSNVVPLIDLVPAPERTTPITGAQWAQEILDSASRAWGSAPLMLDARGSGFDDTSVNGTTLYDYASSAVATGQTVLPVLGSSDSPAVRAGAARLASRCGAGLAVRLLEDEVAAAAADNGARLRRRLGIVLSAISLPTSSVDVVIDMQAVGTSAVTHVNSLATSLPHLPHVTKWRSVTIVGSSAPEQNDVAGYSQFQADRVEWAVWKSLRTKASMPRKVDFGDYAGFAVPLPQGQARTRHPALRYTHDDVVHIVRRKAVAGAGFAVFVDVANHVVAQPWFSGATFSWGDEQIAQVAAGAAGTGNAESWRKIALNHHFTYVVQQLANHPGP